MCTHQAQLTIFRVLTCLLLLGVTFKNVPVFTGTTHTRVSTCARGAGTHGDVLNVQTEAVLNVPHHTAHTHHHNHRHHHRHHTETETVLPFTRACFEPLWHSEQRGHHHESHGFSCRSPALFSISHHLTFQSTARESLCQHHVRPS